jgi:hypothetical protein
VLYDHDLDQERNLHYFELTYCAHFKTVFRPEFRPLPKEYVAHALHLLIYLRGNSGPVTPQGFFLHLQTTEEGNRNMNVRHHISFIILIISLNSLQVHEIWNLFLLTMVISNFDLPNPEIQFDGFIRGLFPQSKLQRGSFSIRMDDILEVGLEVERTSIWNRHLDVTGRTVHIYRPEPMDTILLVSYSKNRVAQ